MGERRIISPSDSHGILPSVWVRLMTKDVDDDDGDDESEGKYEAKRSELVRFLANEFF